MKQVTSLTVAVVLGVCAFACGGSDSSVFKEPTGGPSTPIAPLPELGPMGTASACVSELARADLAPTNLVIIYDKSGSMGDAATGFDPALKWVPVNAGMKEFFADPYSKTLQASLQFFPLSDDTVQSACSAAYGTPAVALTSAADPAFAAALDQAKPSGGTPTLPALQGAISYANTVATAHPDDKTVVVLVTDGEPGFWNDQKKAFEPGCTDNDVAHVAAAAKAAHDGTPTIPTYVVGVGPQLDSLNSVAAAGGTNAAVMVNVNDPNATKSSIVNALNDIRRREVACDFAVPAPPAGQQLDSNAVNVALKKSDGTESVLAYSKDCGSADGWHYDNAGDPKRILLCGGSCNTARTGDTSIAIAFGCQTKVAVQ